MPIKTKIIERTYKIDEKDGSGLIPQEAFSARIRYDENGPKSVYFAFVDCSDEPKRMKNESFTNYETRRGKWVEEKSDRINPTRTREEVLKIVNALEKALEK